MSKLKDAYKRLDAAKKDFEAVIRKECPAHGVIDWKRAGHRQFGYVLRHGIGDRIYVKNARTRARLWITAFDVLQAENE